jgi:Flp pilus assembly protein protease CpaA
LLAPNLLYEARIGILLAVALVYAYFDLFNKRNIPDIFAYVSVAIGFLVTLTYPVPTIEMSLLIVAVIVIVGYITYRLGVLGAGDFYEFAFISFVIPIQAAPLLVNVSQFGLPFVLSVFIATGYVTLLAMPLYYIWLAGRKGRIEKIKTTRRNLYRALFIIIFYGVFLLALIYFSALSFPAAVLIFIIVIPAALVIIFEDLIYNGMVEFVYPRALEEGDMIATGIMKKSDISYFTKKSRHFGRLATSELIGQIKSIKRKIPVYKNAIPLAFFTVIGVVISILFGNLILFLLSVF